MDGALVVLAVNIGVASLFAAGYALIALANKGQRAALWFSGSYLIGMLSPVSDFLVPLVGASSFMEWLSYTSFLAAALSISATFPLFHRAPVPWTPIALLFASGMIVRAAIWGMPPDTIAFGIAYQFHFMLASALAVWVVLRTGASRPLHRLLAAIYAVTGAHFLIKPVLAVHFGSERMMSEYTKTTYALLSQASTGILLLASGIVLLLLVAQRAITDSQLDSETDPLSSLANRRGFERQADVLLARADREGTSVALALFDLDHFKAVNDTYGHAMGDLVIGTFASVLHDHAPSSAIIARIGGEEFVMMIEGANAESLWLHAEAIRREAGRGIPVGGPTITVSAGVAEWRPGESLGGLLRRADMASYRAKEAGRDQVAMAPDPTAQERRVIPLHPRQATH